MKKSVMALALIVFGLLVCVQFAYAIFTPSVPSSCANVHLVWQSMFNTSFGGTVLGQTGDGKCTQFVAYKINGNLTNLLLGYDTPTYANRTVYYLAIEGNFSAAFQSNITTLTYDNVTSFISNLNLTDLAISSYPRAVNSISEASSLYSSTFKAENSSWASSGTGQNLVYTFSINESNSSTNTIVNAGIFNSSLSYLFYNRTLNIIVPVCTTNWTAITTSCNSSEYKITWYNDTSNCNSSSGRPSNVTLSCDYDGNGLIGNFGSFTENNIDLDVYVNGSLGNNSFNYTGTRRVEFREGDDVRLAFNYSFDNVFDLRGLIIDVQDSNSRYGYMVVRGLNVSKTFWVNKINSSSDSVCVKNSEGDIDSLSSNCNASNEDIISCPGNENNVYCSINGSYFVVSGLTRSIVKEWLLNIDGEEVCTNNWTCTGWSECSSGQRSRICTDRAVCNNTIGKPATSENCTVNVCNANWNCSSWMPDNCPSNQTQTRICKDLNSCNISSGRPPITRTCEIEKKNWTPVILIVAVIILLIIVVLIIISKINGNKGDSGYVNVQGMNAPRSPPPGSPPGGYAPIVARPMIQQPRPMPMQPRPVPVQPRPVNPFPTY